MTKPQDFLALIKLKMAKKKITVYKLSKNYYVAAVISQRRLYTMFAGKATPNYKVIEAIFFALDIEISV